MPKPSTPASATREAITQHPSHLLGFNLLDAYVNKRTENAFRVILQRRSLFNHAACRIELQSQHSRQAMLQWQQCQGPRAKEEARTLIRRGDYLLPEASLKRGTD